jgi:hypothetical protein
MAGIHDRSRLSMDALKVALATTAVIAAALGYVAGRTIPPTFVTHIAVAGPAENAISVEADGWSYNIPLDITWIDSTGVVHESGRPGCLGPDAGNVEISFVSVDALLPGAGTRSVVLVDCRHALSLP